MSRVVFMPQSYRFLYTAAHDEVDLHADQKSVGRPTTEEANESVEERERSRIWLR